MHRHHHPKKPEHASARVVVPPGFSGWWCERCEHPAHGIPEEAGSPAKCPHCKKWTAVWIPPSGPDVTLQELRHPPRPERVTPTKERSAQLFAHLRAHMSDPEHVNPDLSVVEREEYGR